MMRSLAEQVNGSQAKVANNHLENDMEAYVQRQQAINSALQQAAAGNNE